MTKYARVMVFVIGMMMLIPTQLLVTADHNDWFTSKYRDGTDETGHEVPANTVPIPVDTEMGTGPCDYSMILYSDTNTWHLDDGEPATIHTAPAGEDWMTPYGNSYWVWGSDQTAAGLYTFVRPVQLPTNAYHIEARIQFGVNDFYKLYIQHGDGGISQHLDTDYSHSNSQQGEPTDLWTDDMVAGLNYFIFEAENSDTPDPDENGTPGTEEGGLMFQIDIIYCRDSGSNTGNCGGDNGDPIIVDTYLSDAGTTMHRSSGTNDPWISTPIVHNNHPTWPDWGNTPSGNAEYLWPLIENASDGYPDNDVYDGRYEQGTYDFRMEFQVPAWAYAVTADFVGLADNRFMPSSYQPLTNPSDSIIITKGTGYPDWAITADSTDDMQSPNYGLYTEQFGTLSDASSIPDDYDLLITARNRISSASEGSKPTVGMIQYELVVTYCVGQAPEPSPCDEDDNYVEVQYASDMNVKYIDPDDALTSSTATWDPVYAPAQQASWANPPSPGIWVWAGVDADGDGVFEDIGQGNFMFRHDFNVPQYAYDFAFAFNGMADNLIIYDPLYGAGSGTDISITPQGALSVPLSSPINPPLYLSPAPSNLQSVVDHYTTSGTTQMIPPTASNSQWDFAQETDLSLVVFARNRQSSDGDDTAGGLAYTLDVSYCEGTEEPDYPDIGDSHNRTKCTTYDGGFEEGIIFSSDTDNYYLDSGSWQAIQTVDGSYSTGAPSNWGMANYYWNVGYSSSYVYNPPLAHQSEWIWNGAYAKADGSHEFIRGFQLPSNVITAHARLFYSADERVVSAYITDQTGAIDYTPSGLEDPGAPITQYNDIFNSGPLVQLVNGANSPQAGDNLYLHIIAEDTEPNWDALAQAPAAWGDYDYVDPAGLRYTAEICFTVEEIPNDPVEPSTNCTEIDAPLVEHTIVSGSPGAGTSGTGTVLNTWHRDVGATTWLNTPIHPLTVPNQIGGSWVGTWPDMTAQWVWPQTDQPQSNAVPYGSDHSDVSGQTFEMMTLVTVPANAQYIQMSFWGHADNRFVGPVMVTPDPYISTPLPAQQLAWPPGGDHHKPGQPMVSGGPIALPTIDPINTQEFEVTWSVANVNNLNNDPTMGGVVWGIDLSYCDLSDGSAIDTDDARLGNPDIPGFTLGLLLSAVVLVAVVTNNRLPKKK